MRRLIFLGFTAILAALFVVVMWQDTNREWTDYQRQFFSTLERDERRGMAGGIHQLIVTDLHRVDRCTTCHLAIDKPQLALAEEPFTAHPGTILQAHPPQQFGCTVCHGGQGLATEVAAAHGDVKHWEEPLLRGSLVQASCRSCHGDLAAIAPHVEQLAQGKALFEAKGCYGCHAINAFNKEWGGTISQELSEIGSKSYLLMEADFEMMPAGAPHDRIAWMRRKLHHPRTLNPGVRPAELPPGEEEVFPSAMPNFGLAEAEVEALTTYLLSLTAFDPPVSYVIPPVPEPEPVYASVVERGKGVFDTYGCAGCHGAGGVGGRVNANAGLGQEIPPLLYVKAYYGDHIQELKTLIRNGRQPTPRASIHSPRPPLYMPEWGTRMSDEELDALVAYLFSLAERLPQSATADDASNAAMPAGVPESIEPPAEPVAVN